MYHLIQQRVLTQYMGQLTEMKPVQNEQKRQRKQVFEMYEYEYEADDGH